MLWYRLPLHIYWCLLQRTDFLRTENYKMLSENPICRSLRPATSSHERRFMFRRLPVVHHRRHHSTGRLPFPSVDVIKLFELDVFVASIYPIVWDSYTIFFRYITKIWLRTWVTKQSPSGQNTDSVCFEQDSGGQCEQSGCLYNKQYCSLNCIRYNIV